MEKLFIQGTETLPTVDFNPNGDLKIDGKAIPEDAKKLFIPIFEWLEKLDVENVEFDVNLYYFNTAVSKLLFDMFFNTVENKNIKNILVKWRYEEGDDDSHESGLMYRDQIPEIKFEFFVYAEL